MTLLHQVHTVTGPFKSYGSYPDPVVAEHMRDHLADVLHVPLVVEPVEEPVTVYRIVASRPSRTIDVGRADPQDLYAAMCTWRAALPGWELHAIPETFTGPATPTTSQRPAYGRPDGEGR